MEILLAGNKIQSSRKVLKSDEMFLNGFATVFLGFFKKYQLSLESVPKADALPMHYDSRYQSNVASRP